MDALLKQATAYLPDFHSPTAQGLGHIISGSVEFKVFLEGAGELLAEGGLLAIGSSTFGLGFAIAAVGIGIVEIVSQQKILETTLREVEKSSESLLGKEPTEFYKAEKEALEAVKVLAGIANWASASPFEKLSTTIDLIGIPKEAPSGTDITKGVTAPGGSMSSGNMDESHEKSSEDEGHDE